MAWISPFALQKLPEQDDDGIAGFDAALDKNKLILAYKNGLFPWPMTLPDGRLLPSIPWFCPRQRGVLFFENLKWSRSLQKKLRQLKSDPQIYCTLNKDFDQVIKACQTTVRPGQSGTWITEQIIQSYHDLHLDQKAVSCEVWREDRLIGGIYGVVLETYATGESMFFLESGASRLALAQYIEFLKTRGLNWLDIQMLTPHMQNLGAHEISRIEFLKKIGALPG